MNFWEENQNADHVLNILYTSPSNGRFTSEFTKYPYAVCEASAKARTISFDEKRKYHSVYMAIENAELTHECFPERSRMGTAIIK